MRDVQRAFNGLYKEVNRETQQWYTVTHPVPSPRPGAVSAAPVLGGWVPNCAGITCFLRVCFLTLKVGTKPRPAYLAELDVTMNVGVASNLL